MALVFNKQLTEGFTYILESEKGGDKPFSVQIIPVDSVRLLNLEDKLLKRDSDNALSIATGSYHTSLCRNAIVGWENLNDDKGKAVPITLDPTGFISEQSLKNLPSMVITEIAGVISATSQDSDSIKLFAEDK